MTSIPPATPSNDYINIGAGTAGCALAARLSERANLRVCLIEAGGSEHHPLSTIPAAVGAAIMSERFGWGLWTTPQVALNGRKAPLPRGKLLGGSGSINGMAYYRGHARDYDDWAAAGNTGWSYAELLPYFLRSEDNPDYPQSPYHHQGGPMRVSFMRRTNPLCEAFNNAMHAQGFAYCEDFNVPEPEGYGYRQGCIGDGRRVSTASAYLRPALARPNLTVLTSTQTRRILLEDGRATGVVCARVDERRQPIPGTEFVIKADLVFLAIGLVLATEFSIDSWDSPTSVLRLPLSIVYSSVVVGFACLLWRYAAVVRVHYRDQVSE
jgi:choline dehydrogenase-like flavoprotein